MYDCWRCFSFWKFNKCLVKTLSGTELCPLRSGRGDTAGTEMRTKRASSPPPRLILPACGTLRVFFCFSEGDDQSLRKKNCTDTYSLKTPFVGPAVNSVAQECLGLRVFFIGCNCTTKCWWRYHKTTASSYSAVCNTTQNVTDHLSFWCHSSHGAPSWCSVL